MGLSKYSSFVDLDPQGSGLWDFTKLKAVLDSALGPLGFRLKLTSAQIASCFVAPLTLANQLKTLAAQLQQIRIENQVQALTNAELINQVSAIQSKLEGPMAQMLPGTVQPPPAQVVPPETWQTTTPQGMQR